MDAPPADAAPLDADLSGLPPAYLGVPECDPLRSDSQTLRDRLAAAGADPTVRLWPGMIHGCIGMVRELDEAHAQLAHAATWLAERY
jgi:acetyl esterase